jgi:hypothetical protein
MHLKILRWRDYPELPMWTNIIPRSLQEGRTTTVRDVVFGRERFVVNMPLAMKTEGPKE